MERDSLIVYVTTIITNIIGFFILYSSIGNTSLTYFITISSSVIWLLVCKKMIIPIINSNPSKTKEKEGIS